MSKVKAKKAKRKKEETLSLINKMDTKGNAKSSAIESVKDLVVGVVGGGLAGSAVGKPSLLVGLGTSLVGHYMGAPLMTSFGLGMMASGGHQIGQGAVSGLSGMAEVKERMKAFGNNLKQRLYLDKIIKPKTIEATEGIGTVQYFRYPQSKDQPLDMGSLDELERQIEESGRAYEKQMSGADDPVYGTDERIL